MSCNDRISPTARLVHLSRRRMRLRIAAHRLDFGYFRTLSERWRSYPGVTHVEARPRTASLIVTFAGDANALLGLASLDGSFELEGGIRRSDPWRPIGNREPSDLLPPIVWLLGGVTTARFLGTAGLIPLSLALSAAGVAFVVNSGGEAPPTARSA